MALKTEKRNVSDFHAIELAGTGTLEIVQDPAAPESLVIEADEAVLAKLKSVVSDGVLHLGFDMPLLEWIGWGLEWLLTADKTIRYRVSLKDISAVTLSGAAHVKSAGLKASGDFRLVTSGAGKAELGELASAGCRLVISGTGNLAIGRLQAKELAATISGTGDVEATGSADTFDLRISGAGKIRAGGLQTRKTHITISGTGNAEVAASESLDVSISGTGDVRYYGSPQVTQSVSGTGKVKKAD
jgi:hypothetical protein